MMTDLPQSVLRYWETVFDNLNPNKSNGGNRQYSELDVELIKTIKELLYEQGYTIKGAMNKFNREENIVGPEPVKKKMIKNPVDNKHQIVKEIKKIIELLES